MLQRKTHVFKSYTLFCSANTTPSEQLPPQHPLAATVLLTPPTSWSCPRSPASPLLTTEPQQQLRPVAIACRPVSQHLSSHSTCAPRRQQRDGAAPARDRQADCTNRWCANFV